MSVKLQRMSRWGPYQEAPLSNFFIFGSRFDRAQGGELLSGRQISVAIPRRPREDKKVETAVLEMVVDVLRIWPTQQKPLIKAITWS
jgi:hypothetical protein